MPDKSSSIDDSRNRRDTGVITFFFCLFSLFIIWLVFWIQINDRNPPKITSLHSVGLKDCALIVYDDLSHGKKHSHAKLFSRNKWIRFPDPPESGEMLQIGNTIILLGKKQEYQIEFKGVRNYGSKWRFSLNAPKPYFFDDVFDFNGNVYYSLKDTWNDPGESAAVSLFEKKPKSIVASPLNDNFNEFFALPSEQYAPFNGKLYAFQFNCWYKYHLKYVVYDGRNWSFSDVSDGKEIKDCQAEPAEEGIFIFTEPGYPGDEDGLTDDFNAAQIDVEKFDGQRIIELPSLNTRRAVNFSDQISVSEINGVSHIFTAFSAENDGIFHVWVQNGKIWKEMTSFKANIYSHAAHYKDNGSLLIGVLLLLLININYCSFIIKKRRGISISLAGMNIRLPGLSRRFVSWLIDTTLVYSIAIFVSLSLLALSDYFFKSYPFVDHPEAIFIVTFLLFPTCYHVLCDWLFGRTIGKALLKMRVITIDLKKCGIYGAFIRQIMRFLDWPVFYIVGACSYASTQKYQRIGDILAKTIVVVDCKELKQILRSSKSS